MTDKHPLQALREKQIAEEIQMWKGLSEKCQTVGVFINDPTLIEKSGQYMAKARGAVGRLIELERNPIAKPFPLEYVCGGIYEQMEEKPE